MRCISFLRRVNFYWKGKQSPLLDIVTFIQHELEGSDSCIGYRAIHQRCIKNGLMVSRIIAAQIMKHVDPIAKTRRRRTIRRRLYYSLAPNWVWYLDGYGNLKPYDFEIHGCVDGYSRWVLWLSVLWWYPKKTSKGSAQSLFYLSLNCKRSSSKNCGWSRYRKCKYCRFSKILEAKSFRWFIWVSEFSIWKINNESENWIILVSVLFFQGNFHEGIYDNTDYLQIQCFKFCFFL